MLKKFIPILLLSLFIYNCKPDVKLKSKVEFKTNQVDTTLLFGVWGIDEGGDAEIRITNKEFYVVDFFERSKYTIIKNKLIIHNSDFYHEGTIINLTKDTLKIKWDIADEQWSYWRFDK